MGDIVKVSWSGGKDSTCAVMKHLERGDTVKAVCYIPMFTDTIPLLLKDHYEHILRTADKFRSMGAEVHIVKGLTYYDYVHKRASRGKYNGLPFGFPRFCKAWCGFKRDSKLKSLSNIALGQYDYEDIGIAADETRRHAQLTDKKRSILCEMGITEPMAIEYCKEHGILSPHYGSHKRDGCTLCPHAKAAERVRWFEQYPEAIPIVLELQEFVKNEKPDQTPLRHYKWFIEEDGTIN